MCVRFWLPCDPPSPPGDKSHLNWPSSSNTGTDEENRGYEGTVIFNANTFCGIALPMLRAGLRLKDHVKRQIKDQIIITFIKLA